MNDKLRGTLACVLLFLVLLAFLWGMLAVSAMIPNSILQERYEESALFYGKQDAFHFYNGDRWNAIADHYADSILLNISWHIGAGDSPFLDVIDTDYYDGEEYGENIGLLLSVTEGKEPNTDYTRYWHGGAMFVRLFHLFADVNTMKMIGFIAVLALVALTMGILMKKRHFDLAVLLLLSLAAVQIWNIRLSLEYQTAFLITFALCPLYLILERRGDRYLALLGVAGGVLTAFFDFLTTETLTILLPLILVVAVRAKENRLVPLKKSILLMLESLIAWGGSYMMTFLVKWTAASMVTGENAFALAFHSVAERVGVGEALGSTSEYGFFSPIFANLTMIFGGNARVQIPRAVIGTVIFLGVLVSVWYLFRAKNTEKNGAILMLMLGALVIVRFFVLNNHSYLHEFFTYRALAAPILAMLTALWLNMTLPVKKGVRR